MTGCGQSAGTCSATTTFEGTRGGVDAHPLVAMHTISGQENQYLGR